MRNLSLNLIEEGRIEGREEGREEGRIEGREEGRIEGREEGRKEGKAEERIEGIRNVMKNLSFTFEQAIQALGIPKEEVEEYRTALTNK